MLARLQEKLFRTRSVFKKITALLEAGGERESILDQLTEALILADVGTTTTAKLIDTLRRTAPRDANQIELLTVLKKEIINILSAPVNLSGFIFNHQPAVILFVGVNGGGKTTSIAKLAARAQAEGKKVMMVAADTFRAAAQEQLTTWGQRLDVSVIKGQYGADPASVVFDAVKSFKSKKADVLLVDTAGRLHTNINLMNELEKVSRLISREMPEARKESLLVLDATIGQNALAQAREFLKFSGLTGIFLTKIDGTARGGVAIAIVFELKLPIKFLGTGEGPEDIEVFSPEDFVEALFK